MTDSDELVRLLAEGVEAAGGVIRSAAVSGTTSERLNVLTGWVVRARAALPAPPETVELRYEVGVAYAEALADALDQTLDNDQVQAAWNARREAARAALAEREASA